MYIFPWLLLIGLGIVYPKSKTVAKIQCIFIIFRIGFAKNIADLDNYEATFTALCKNPGLGGTTANLLFSLLLKIVGVFQSFLFAMVAVAFVGMVILYHAIRKYTDKIALVLSLYMIAPFTIDAAQKRNFLAMCIWVYFAWYLLEACKKKENRKKNVLLYLAGVFIAGNVHAAVYASALFVLVAFWDSFWILAAGIGFVFASLAGYISWYDKIVDFIRQYDNGIFKYIIQKYTSYYYSFNEQATYTRMIVTVMFLIMTFVLFGMVGRWKAIKNNSRLSDEINSLQRLNLVVLFFLPLLFFSMEFYRIQRNLLVVFYAVLSNGISPGFKGYKGYLRDYFILGSMLLMALFYLIIDSLYWNYDSVFTPLLM
jgi:hypothetical protein